MDFQVGDKAVYPSHGVGVIQRIETKQIGGSDLNFYVLEIINSGATLMVPTAGSSKTGMRALICDDEIASIHNVLKNPVKVSQTTWNRRFREYSEKMRTGSVIDIAEVLRDLNTLSSGKDLSYGEKKMMEKALELIVSEICAATRRPSDTVEQELLKVMA